ncbi:MAG: DUF805 domain-containing protein [Opitutales bacterium]|nr:DUF805 domain-containing protein [Opitutales bacterium]
MKSNQSRYQMTFGEAITRFWTRAFQVSGRATRSEFWFAQLFIALVSVVITVFLPPVIPICKLVMFVPHVTLTCRRLHDSGMSGTIVFVSWALVPVAGLSFTVFPLLGILFLALVVSLKFIILFAIFFDSTKGRNKYGESEKYPSTIEI